MTFYQIQPSTFTREFMPNTGYWLGINLLQKVSKNPQMPIRYMHILYAKLDSRMHKQLRQSLKPAYGTTQACLLHNQNVTAASLTP